VSYELLASIIFLVLCFCAVCSIPFLWQRLDCLENRIEELEKRNERPDK
jgi:hypothetical protein